MEIVTLPAGLGDSDSSQEGAVLRLGFRPPEEWVPGFEIIDLATLHQRRRRRGRRPDLVHRVDFHGSACWQLGTRPAYAVLSTLLGQPRSEYNRPEPTVSAEILQLLLVTVLLQIDRLPHPEGSGDPHAGDEVYTRFRAELERSYATTRRAADYAQHLGYTVKTLTRACMAATGQPVKHVIDGRVALEGRRLIAHTDEPVATIARRLGFPEPTNFGKFFTRHVGVTPGAFRQTHQVHY
ncbi:transcriptional regulator [Streptomyces scabiei]|nr:transcriptional regulator [Streptomyces scabiei]